MQPNNGVPISVSNVIIPRSGPKSIGIKLNFTTEAEQIIDLGQYVQAGEIEYVQTVYVDNADNPAPIEIVTSLINQRVIIPAGGQGYISVLQPTPPILTVSTVAADVNVYFQFLNVPVQPIIWQPVPEKLGSAIGGEAIVTDTPFAESVALVADADVAVDITLSNGDVLAAFPLQKGYNPLRATMVSFAAGSIFALRN